MPKKGIVCAVAECPNSSCTNKEFLYHRFPLDKKTRQAWIIKTQRKDKFNPNNSRICSRHFLPEDYKRDQKAELLGYQAKSLLKLGAIPSLYLRENIPQPETSERALRFLEKQRKEKNFASDEIVEENDPSNAEENISMEDLSAKLQKETVCGDLFHLSQPTVHRISRNVSETICRTIGQHIKMPETDIEKTWRTFHQKAGFPGVIGLIDETHIPIISPGGNQAELFRNRKGHFSINVQVVCGPNEEIFDIVCRWPGSAHDSRVFENRAIVVRLEQNYQRLGHLLGDAGYGQKAYLFTPLSSPTTAAERSYNKAHKTTRSLVERSIGRLKRRFPCLYFELQTKLRHTLLIIPACAILYNIGIRTGDTWTVEGDEDQLPPIDVEPTTVQAAENPTGQTIRRAFINQHFNTG